MSQGNYWWRKGRDTALKNMIDGKNVLQSTLRKYSLVDVDINHYKETGVIRKKGTIKKNLFNYWKHILKQNKLVKQNIFNEWYYITNKESIISGIIREQMFRKGKNNYFLA